MQRSPGITTKIFAIAASILVLLFAIAINTHSKIRIINDEVRELSESILPISEMIDKAIIATLEQEIHLERALRLLVKQPTPSHQIKQEITAFETQGSYARSYFEQAVIAVEPLLSKGSNLAQLDIKNALIILKKHNETFHEHAMTLMQQLQRRQEQVADIAKAGLAYTEVRHEENAPENSDLKETTLDRWLLDQEQKLDAEEDKLNTESETIMELLQSFAIATSQSAKEHQERILLQNILFTLFAVVFGLLYSGIISRKISSPIVALNKQVFQALNQQQLQKLSVTSSDEVGRLTRHFNQALGNLQTSEKLKDMFGQYLDPRLISHLEAGSSDFKLDGEKQAVTVMLSSLDNLDWSESDIAFKDINAQQMIAMVNEYLKVQTTDRGKYKGVINFTHTDILTFWCHPFSSSDKHVQQACKSMLAQVEGAKRFRQFLHEEYPEFKNTNTIQLRAGLTCGDLVVANMGPSGARSFTVIGDEVNTASRLKGVARFFQVNTVISSAIAESLSHEFVTRPLGWVKVPGKDEAINVVHLIGMRDNVDYSQLHLELYAHAYIAFESRDYTKALNLFREYALLVKNDIVPQKFVSQCQTLLNESLPEDYQHTWLVEQK